MPLRGGGIASSRRGHGWPEPAPRVLDMGAWVAEHDFAAPKANCCAKDPFLGAPEPPYCFVGIAR
jgi:hypothetical protein